MTLRGSNQCRSRFAFKPIHNDGECCWCDYLHQMFDEGHYDFIYTKRGNGS